MDDKKRLPDAELAVMQAIWAVGGEVSRGDLDGALSSHGWSANTVNTYLTRLCEKGFLSSRREGRNNLYTPLVSFEAARHALKARAARGQRDALVQPRGVSDAASGGRGH